MYTERHDSWETAGPGVVIDSRYKLDDVLGEGGMGTVWSARHLRTDKRVAIKLLHPNLRMQEEVTTRFLVEARVPAAIAHPAMVPVMDAGTTNAGVPYLVMELLKGATLAESLRVELPAMAEIRRIALEILDCLTAAHTAGFVHRDLKPENIFLVQPTKAVKVLDFGIAKLIGHGQKGCRTAAGEKFGTPPYMSPEQLSGAKELDHRADLWAVGVLIYEMATGARPYGTHGFDEQLRQIRDGKRVPLSKYLEQEPALLADFLSKALAKNSSRRFRSAKDMAVALRAIPDVPLFRRRAPEGAPGKPSPLAVQSVSALSLAPPIVSGPRHLRSIWRTQLLALTMIAAMGNGDVADPHTPSPPTAPTRPKRPSAKTSMSDKAPPGVPTGTFTASTEPFKKVDGLPRPIQGTSGAAKPRTTQGPRQKSTPKKIPTPPSEELKALTDAGTRFVTLW